MKQIILYIFGLCLVGCSNVNETEVSLLPREYYRPLLTEKDIGVAFSKNQESLDDLIPKIIQHEKVSEAIYLTHEGETIIGLRLMPYHRKAGNEIIEEVAALSALEATSIIHDPRRYRVMERLSREKKMGGISNNWVNEWMTLRERTSSVDAP
ncbi:hypothetical protein JOC85_001527 [Bacillus mesophilus]|uniref:Sporulation protein n=1 Tax=Bacillus mesophilus TaxID=1808955 RepID=A0A6M0Q9I4_9BACI|nr:hypothetical protein [Bacillus mesophilus]MBM7660755.1 hypothetical protein [Bacillus mesophilus]NEY71698.1 hypothetical protein [Bacillus mesophilus]